jgi:hypothetical protein
MKSTNRLANTTTIKDALMQAHLDEAVGKRKADIWNLGKEDADTFIVSKTTEGELCSRIDPRTKKVTHTWRH